MVVRGDAHPLPWQVFAETPSARRVVQRRSLFEQLSATPDGGVALVCGPPGSGALGDRGAAEAAQERALELAEPEGIILPFALAPVRGLLEQHRGHRTAHAALVATILDVLTGTPPSQDASSLREPLSEAELRVVRYLPSNLKATEIAAELCVSANTVRTHLRHIYAKLDAHTRTEAVSRARRLGVLAPPLRLR